MARDTAGAVLVPLLQSFISGCLVGLVALAGAYVFDYPPAWAGLAGAGVAVWSWFISIARWNKIASALAGVPEADQLQPYPEEVLRVEVISENGHNGKYLDLPTDYARFVELASGIVEGVPLSEGSWTGKAGPYSRAEFRRLRAELLRRGIVRWQNPRAHQQGLEISPSGRALFSYVASAQVNGLRAHTDARGVESKREG